VPSPLGRCARGRRGAGGCAGQRGGCGCPKSPVLAGRGGQGRP